MRYFKKITGDRLYLSPVNPEDAEIYAKWFNDYDVTRYLSNYPEMISPVSQRPALEKMAAEGQNYAIVLSDGDVLLGNTALYEIDHIQRQATISIFIGEAEYRSRGYGKEAMRLMLNYGFKFLNLHNIMLTVNSDNERAMTVYRKLGFREMGRRREALFRNGLYIDTVHMDILDTDFYAKDQ